MIARGRRPDDVTLCAIRRCGAGGARLVGLIAVVLLAGLLLGCGGDDEPAAERPAADEPFLSLSEVASVLEDAKLSGRPVDGGGQREEVVEAARFAGDSGQEFEVLVFASERDARQALPSIADREEVVSTVRAANVVALFAEQYREVEAYEAAATALQRLRQACSDESGAERLRRLCFDYDGGIAPGGEGVDRDEAEEAEESIVVGDLRYEAVLARILNPYIRPDQQLVSGLQPDEGKIWFGVFLRVCNESDETQTPSGNLALVDAFGKRLEPYELPPHNAFAYDPRPVAPDSCLPPEGSAPVRVSDGALVLFETSSDFLGNFPLALEVTGAGGGRERVIVNF